MSSASQDAYLIVNADDYGYFHCVSRGILEAASQGIVTATGVLANSPHFAEQAAWLRKCDTLDVGIHLNLTHGIPLTADLQRKLARWSGHFPTVYSTALALLSGAVSIDDVRREWRAQIERCIEIGLAVRFLNSHEHVHMLPSLFPVAKALAEEYKIPHLRFPTSPLDWPSSVGSLFRSVVIRTLGTINRRHAGRSAHFLGMGVTGKLNLQYLQRSIPQLSAGEVYELMCHPGRFDAGEVSDARLMRYHDWEGELRTLTSPLARELLYRHGVRLIGYRHVIFEDNRLVARLAPVEMAL